MVNVDTVYQKVLALANKEQRGYITPQEFNLFADHAQMEIFEQYFYDSDQFKRRSGNDSEYHDMVDLIDEKLYFFKKSRNQYLPGTAAFFKIDITFFLKKSRNQSGSCAATWLVCVTSA